jgi:hypothetical protein
VTYDAKEEAQSIWKTLTVGSMDPVDKIAAALEHAFQAGGAGALVSAAQVFKDKASRERIERPDSHDDITWLGVASILHVLTLRFLAQPTAKKGADS